MIPFDCIDLSKASDSDIANKQDNPNERFLKFVEGVLLFVTVGVKVLNFLFLKLKHRVFIILIVLILDNLKNFDNLKKFRKVYIWENIYFFLDNFFFVNIV